MTLSAYFIIPEKRPAATIRLFCFPYAGGDIATYLPWLEHLDQHIELVIVQLPGRGRRQHETPFSQMEPLVEDLFGAMFSMLDKPFAFFGHSMGSKIAFELTKRMHQSGFPCPEHFFASASPAPWLRRRATPIHRLPEAGFLERIKKLAGVPQAVLDNQELMRFLMPMLRADFKLVETYVGKLGNKLPCVASVFGGSQDPVVTSGELHKWFDHFDERGTSSLFEGGHFYLHSVIKEITAIIDLQMVGYRKNTFANVYAGQFRHGSAMPDLKTST